jgi:hypothetical protein
MTTETEAQRRWRESKKSDPAYKAKARAASKRYAQAHPEKVAARAKARRLAAPPLSDAQRLELSAKVAARHAERMKDPVYREKRRLASQVERRRVAADPRRAARARELATARRMAKPAKQAAPARVTDSRTAAQLVAAAPNSVFALAVTQARPVTPVQGAGAKRREGGETHLSDQQFKDRTWRAPWGAGYALHRPKSTS